MKDLICFSHLRWDFVFQRPQHLMTRFANDVRVFYFEEPIFTNIESDNLKVRQVNSDNLFVVVPELSHTDPGASVNDRLHHLLDRLLMDSGIEEYISWYYSPLALTFSDHLSSQAIVYDCMDELSAFKGAPPELVAVEKQLLQKADLVFTGGYRLFEAKKNHHANIFAVPSSIDKAVFAPARNIQNDPPDQESIAHPRLGFFGVIDERFDTALVKAMAELKPEWHFVFVGPVVKIDPAELPQAENIHYLGIKNYTQLPAYIAGWDVCIMPFAINASTEFISPTKTPEFLAAGKPVISTPIHDVVHPYKDLNLVGIAQTAPEFIEIASEYLAQKDQTEWLAAVDQFLAGISWDKSFLNMKTQLHVVLRAKSIVHKLKSGEYV